MGEIVSYRILAASRIWSREGFPLSEWAYAEGPVDERKGVGRRGCGLKANS